MSSSGARRLTTAAAALAALVALRAAGVLTWAWAVGSPPRLNGHRRLRVLRRALTPLSTGRSEAYLRCVEHYDPNDPSNEPFHPGPPPTGFRGMDECILPYHKNPEWQIWPEPVGSFERDQKIASMYTLATGMFKDINSAMREDNEDGMRRLAPMIWEIRQLLRFEVSKICTPEGRRCKPYIGKLVRGLMVPQDQVEELAAQYKVGTEFTWPAFTSCHTEEGGFWPFDGNLNFEIECNIDPKTMGVDEVYAPVRIGRFLGGTHEVLLPPQTKFKVVGEREVESVTENDLPAYDSYTKILEVVELPTPLPKPR